MLRCLVGLESIDSGSIYLDGQDITNVPAQLRGVSMIFQQYCLFPTMNLYDNVSFGLRMKKVPAKEIEERVHDVVSMVNMQDHLDKYPYQLSGGEQQRAALARGLIMNPKVLLLDEPFSAIDAKLRKELQIYLKKIHRELNMTSVFVTHDQEEALSISDKILLMEKGKISQYSSPKEMYMEPQNMFAAKFLGNPPMNFVPGEKVEDGICLLLGDENVTVKKGNSTRGRRTERKCLRGHPSGGIRVVQYRGRRSDFGSDHRNTDTWKRYVHSFPSR